MKRLFLLALLLILAGLLVAGYVEREPGYVLIAFAKTTIEMSLWTAIVIGLLAFIILYFVARLALYFLGILAFFAGRNKRLGLMTRWLNSRQGRQLNKANRGLISFMEGRWAQSRKLLVKSASRSQNPLVNYLLAARASHELGENEEARRYLELASGSDEGLSLPVALVQAELQLEAGQLEQSLATLTRILDKSAKHPAALKLLVKVYEKLSDWSKLVELIPVLSKLKVFSKQELMELEEIVYHALLSESAKTDADDALTRLHDTWQRMPRELVQNPCTIVLYAKLLMKVGAAAEAEKLLRLSIKREWSNALVHQYGLVQGSEEPKRLLLAESWLKERTNNAELLLCLGRLSLMNKLWGKAREYFEASLHLDERSETFAELGRLYANLGEHQKSNQYFQRGLLFSTHGLPGLPMPEPKRATSD
jgi:HemY protein